jgi:uncharacterized oligopeptide transporter (OPT) family protein
MAIKQLTPEQIQSMSLEEKDRWWLANVYRGDMPQLTLRAAVTGVFLGAFLSLTNLYIGARTGWSLGVGVTSVILSFALFKLLSKMGAGKEMTLLENNAMQSIATSAGYTNSALFTSFAAYTMWTHGIVPIYQVFVWLMILAVIGVLFAFPMKKRFINDEQLPFPEGMAAGVVMEGLHESDDADGMFKAKLLVWAGSIAAFVEIIRSDMVMRAFFALKGIPAFWDDLFYGDGRLARWLGEKGLVPRIMGTTFHELTIQWDSSLIFFATGGLMGVRAGASMLLGGVINYFVLAPMMIERGIIKPEHGHYGYASIVAWSLWGGVACMTTSSLYSFFSKPKIILDALRGLRRKGGPPKADVLGHIELPIGLSIVGVPIAALMLMFLGYVWFDIRPWLSAIAVPLVFVFSLIAVNSTGLTAITPTGALGKLTQLTYRALARNIVTNILTAGITAEVSSNTSNLLMDIKPGYMLGAKPRQQAVGHMLGAFAGLALSVPVWYFVFIQGDISRYGSEKLPVPGAQTWYAVAKALDEGLSFLDPTIVVAVIVGALIGLAVEISKQVTKDRFPLSAVGFGLAFMLSFHDIWAMCLGSLIFGAFEHRRKTWEKAQATKGEVEAPAVAPVKKKPWYALAAENTETICAGAIAGGALMGIAVTVLEVLVLPKVMPDAPEARALAPLVKHAIEALR